VKKNKILLLALALTMVLTLFAGCGSKSEDGSGAAASGEDTSLTDLQERGVFVLGCDDEFPPMGFIDEDGELTGFDIELAAAVAEKLGVDFEPKPIDWEAKEMELSSGNIDVIWNGYTIDKERLEKVEFTKPYLNNAQLLVVKADSDIASITDLKDKTVGYQISSAAESIYEDNEELAAVNAQVYDDYQQALLDLKSSDRLDAVIVDKILIEYIMQKEPDTYKVLEEPLGTEYFGIGSVKGSTALSDAIDKALDELQEDGTIDEIAKKYFDSNIVIRDVPRLTVKDFE
jgi:polar amino acid transport system substrate-binding protein